MRGVMSLFKFHVDLPHVCVFIFIPFSVVLSYVHWPIARYSPRHTYIHTVVCVDRKPN
jgi:hypothetical protein